MILGHTVEESIGKTQGKNPDAMLDWFYWYFTLVLIIDICNIHNVYCNHSTCICNLSIVSSQSASMCRRIGHGIKELLLCTMHALHSQSLCHLLLTAVGKRGSFIHCQSVQSVRRDFCAEGYEVHWGSILEVTLHQIRNSRQISWSSV